MTLTPSQKNNSFLEPHIKSGLNRPGSSVPARILAACITSVTVAVNYTDYAPMIPILEKDLHISSGEAGLLSTFLFLGLALAYIPAGILADRYGSRIVLIYASLLITIGGTLLPLFPNFAWILSWRVLVGLGAGAAFVAGARISATLGEHSSLGQGLYGGAVQIGSGLGLLVTPFLLNAFGWRWSFAIWGLFNLASVIAWLLVDNGERAHIARNINLRAGLRSKSVWTLGLAHMGTFGLGNAVAAWIAIYLLHQFGLPLGLAASLGSITLLAGVFFRPLGGFLLARNLIRPISLLRLGTVMACLGVILLAIPVRSPLLAVPGMGLIAIGATMPYAPVFNLAARLRGVSTGIAQGLISVLSCPTVLIGPPLMGLLFERTGNFSLAFGAIALFGFVAVLASFLAGPAIAQEASVGL